MPTINELIEKYENKINGYERVCEDNQYISYAIEYEIKIFKEIMQDLEKLKDYLLDFNHGEVMADELINILLGDE